VVLKPGAGQRYEQENKKLGLAQITLVARWFGFGLIVLTWFKLIPLVLGWIGFAVAAISFIVEAIYKKNLASSSDDDNSGARPKS